MVDRRPPRGKPSSPDWRWSSAFGKACRGWNYNGVGGGTKRSRLAMGVRSRGGVAESVQRHTGALIGRALALISTPPHLAEW
jgi:hypothetical protein